VEINSILLNIDPILKIVAIILVRSSSLTSLKLQPYYSVRHQRMLIRSQTLIYVRGTLGKRRVLSEYAEYVAVRCVIRRDQIIFLDMFKILFTPFSFLTHFHKWQIRFDELEKTISNWIFGRKGVTVSTEYTTRVTYFTEYITTCDIYVLWHLWHSAICCQEPLRFEGWGRLRVI